MAEKLRETGPAKGEVAAYERLRDALGDVNSWLTFAEAKNGVLIALEFALAGVLLGTIVGDHPLTGDPACAAKAALTAALVAGSISLASLFARTSAPKEKARVPLASGNVFFFGDAAKHTTGSYFDLFVAKAGSPGLRPTGNETDLSAQVVTNSQIAMLKLRLFNLALIVAVVGVVIPGAWVLLRVIWK